MTYEIEIDALFKRFSQLDVRGKITLKIEVHEFVFSNAISMCPPLMKIKTKDAPKSVKSVKCETSMWEQINEMNMMVGSSRTPSVACKVGHDNKKKKNEPLYG